MSKFTIILYLDQTVKVPFDISSDDTIYQVKQKIEKSYEIKIENQELYLGDKQLEDNHTVKNCNIGLEEKVRLVRKAEGSIQVFIMDINPTDNQKSTAIILKPSSTVLELKNLYTERKSLPVEYQRFIYQGKQLEDNRTLTSYDIVHESNIHLVARLKGGL
nr:5221_t:CDS:1 [Entrophospora candida]